MNFFNYIDQTLHAESVSITHLAAEYGTPLYVYSQATIDRHYKAFESALSAIDALVCYAVKANSNIAILQRMAQLGAGFDIVSGGELARVLKAGGNPQKIVFSGVGKTHAEISEALVVGIKCFNVESASELYRIEQVAQSLGAIAPISLRVNPNIDAQTHPYISTGLKQNKFGIETEEAIALYEHVQQSSALRVEGIDCHIGSQLTSLEPFIASLDLLLALVDQLAERGIALHHIDIGGGLGVPYKDEQPPHPQHYGDAIIERLADRELQLIIEPGRAIMANAGVLVTQVEFIKRGSEKCFAIVDAAMNDLLRPSLYSAWQDIVPVVDVSTCIPETYDIVGPICETGDFLGKDRQLSIKEGDLLAVCSAGAYGFSMASNYNSRVKSAEVLVANDHAHLIRSREVREMLWQDEHLLP